MQVYFLASGFAKVPRGLFAKGQGVRRVRFPMLATLIKKDDYLVLYDTGNSTNFFKELKPLRYRHNWLFFNTLMKVQFDTIKDSIVYQIKELGFSPDDVKYVVLSHLHLDHAGGMKDFPKAKFFVTRNEWEAATAPDSNKHAYVREHYEDLGLDVETVTTDPSKPVLSFSASFDMLGDGSMVIVDLPGHTPGTAGLLVTLPSGRKFFFIGDSSYFPEGYEKNLPKSWFMQKMISEGPQAIETVKKLHDLFNNHPEIEIVGAHDHRIPGRYDLAPVYYE
ncbi:MAG: MBL fold metallo-hydrolase [Proteobacteria bacterium]|nr:MBL fold metallo-hydrolase [Pseudomonadota bacterium]